MSVIIKKEADKYKENGVVRKHIKYKFLCKDCEKEGTYEYKYEGDEDLTYTYKKIIIIPCKHILEKMTKMNFVTLDKPPVFEGKVHLVELTGDGFRFFAKFSDGHVVEFKPRESHSSGAPSQYYCNEEYTCTCGGRYEYYVREISTYTTMRNISIPCVHINYLFDLEKKGILHKFLSVNNKISKYFPELPEKIREDVAKYLLKGAWVRVEETNEFKLYLFDTETSVARRYCHVEIYPKPKDLETLEKWTSQFGYGKKVLLKVDRPYLIFKHEHHSAPSEHRDSYEIIVVVPKQN